ncbi:hypothetical protein [Flavobacterium reichenbachii]|uniref:Uncharacterized protein n=1 Tax=Flavobacterium reichenbachii TaxID=362418 RepID=A0A085ZMA0_9FLAO|nr:hypothetical protein [Flavobacterium reichenbachii]KFF05564.1 hypothetical protein IW19_08580 [Flavobacterium reichenbachii]OXB17901.1 hypothetical protein B0A68_02900 [Flavobacterium reichenbachii]
MSKLIKNNKEEDLYSHNEQAYKFIEEHLPYTYVELAITCLVNKGYKTPSKALIRNVKNKTIFRNDILLALVEVADDNKKAIERIKLLTS